MLKSIISEGKTTNEAIEKGLKQLNVSKNMVDIKVLENEEKRSFFNILAPRVVKVELTVKESEKNNEKIEKKEIERKVDEKDLEKSKNNIKECSVPTEEASERVLLTIGMEVLLPDLEQNQKYLREMIYF